MGNVQSMNGRLVEPLLQSEADSDISQVALYEDDRTSVISHRQIQDEAVSSSATTGCFTWLKNNYFWGPSLNQTTAETEQDYTLSPAQFEKYKSLANAMKALRTDEKDLTDRCYQLSNFVQIQMGFMGFVAGCFEIIVKYKQVIADWMIGVGIGVVIVDWITGVGILGIGVVVYCVYFIYILTVCCAKYNKIHRDYLDFIHRYSITTYEMKNFIFCLDNEDEKRHVDNGEEVVVGGGGVGAGGGPGAFKISKQYLRELGSDYRVPTKLKKSYKFVYIGNGLLSFFEGLVLAWAAVATFNKISVLLFS